MYKNPVMLSSESHRSLKVAPVSDLSFTRSLNSCPILGPEYFIASRFYPIVFTRSGKMLLSMVILGLKGNLFVDDAGHWEQGAYLPACFRRYPFLTDESRAEAPVYIDAAFDGFDAAEGQRLFSDEGDKTPFLEEFMKFLQEYHLQSIATDQFLARLEELKLFRDVEAKMKLPGSGPEWTLKGLLMVDEKALYDLPDDQLAAMARNGYLARIYAHLHSLTNMNEILRREQEAAKAPQGMRN
ncbi:SapC protein [Syntrophus gentianae]|uniref:SapC protein n=1 Tax=Syntrophus gentianae TaxID=43775 RepID=A0A1H7ZF40_9BACT|nr:SapC family protein [Syntrophus gentianae]SEM56936.1 SapC protein [Syntrophus gentianae]